MLKKEMAETKMKIKQTPKTQSAATMPLNPNLAHAFCRLVLKTIVRQPL